jgi:hypothetical protein
MKLKEIGWKRMDLTDLAQDTEKLWHLAMDNFLTTWENISFQWQALLHGDG